MHFNRIVPIYPLTEGLKQRRIRRIMKSVVDGYSAFPCRQSLRSIKKKEGSSILSAAVSRVHFPSNDEILVELSDKDSVYGSPPHKTLSYNEFFLMELGLALKKRDVSRTRRHLFHPTGELTGRLFAGLAV